MEIRKPNSDIFKKMYVQYSNSNNNGHGRRTAGMTSFVKDDYLFEQVFGCVPKYLNYNDIFRNDNMSPTYQINIQ